MKYINKRGPIKGWTIVTTNAPSAKVKRWCQLQTSKGRVYNRPCLNEWHFEFSEDALIFKMVWANVPKYSN